jgi:hypothetical protein
MPYKGPERRVHKVYMTRNTEYHTRKDVCVGVRDRLTGSWLRRHTALTKPLCGSIRFENGGIIPNSGLPRIGDSLYFHDNETDVVTSRLESVERPAKTIVDAYAL